MSGPYGNFINGWPVNDIGRLILIYDDPGTPIFYHGGKAFSVSMALSCTLVKSAKMFQAGIGFSADGLMLVVVLAGAPPAGSTVQSGILIAPGGYMCLDQRAITGYQDGLARTAIGAAAV